MDEEEKSLSLVLFFGTDDKLPAAAVLAVGAAAMGRTVKSCTRPDDWPSPAAAVSARTRNRRNM